MNIYEGLKEGITDNIYTNRGALLNTFFSCEELAKIILFYLQGQGVLGEFEKIEMPQNPYDKVSHTLQEKVNWIIHNNAQQDLLTKAKEMGGELGVFKPIKESKCR